MPARSAKYANTISQSSVVMVGTFLQRQSLQEKGHGTWGKRTWGEGEAKPAAPKPVKLNPAKADRHAEACGPSGRRGKAGQRLPMRSARTPMLRAYLWAQL